MAREHDESIEIEAAIPAYHLRGTPGQKRFELETGGMVYGDPDGYSYATGRKRQAIPPISVQSQTIGKKR